MTGRRRSCTTSRKATGACPWYGSQTETRGLSRVSGRALRTKLLYTAAYHPSADGQSERSNQTAEIWLRHWQNLHQDVDWNEGLAPMHEHGLQSQFQQAIGQILCHVHCPQLKITRDRDMNMIGPPRSVAIRLLLSITDSVINTPSLIEALSPALDIRSVSVGHCDHGPTLSPTSNTLTSGRYGEDL